MKTTLELPTSTLRKVKATAARKGQSMTAYVTSALEAKLARDTTLVSEKPWMQCAGALKDDIQAISEITQRIEAEFKSVRAEDWQ